MSGMTGRNAALGHHVQSRLWAVFDFVRLFRLLSGPRLASIVTAVSRHSRRVHVRESRPGRHRDCHRARTCQS